MIVYIGLQITYTILYIDIFVLWHCSKGPIDPVPPAHAHTQKQRVPEKRLRRRKRGEGAGAL